MLREVAEPVARLAAECATALSRGGTVFFFGNGGSSAEATHLAAELVGRFRVDRGPLRSIALTDSAILTAVANDFEFEEVFSRQLRGLGSMGDVAIALTTSGRSRNVLRGLETARELGLFTSAFTGADGLAMGNVDIAIPVASRRTDLIQEVHLAAGHVLCECIEAASQDPLAAPDSDAELSTLVTLRGLWARADATVVWANGCFDLLHEGHLRFLRSAKSLGDILIVGINSDASAARRKGKGRPIVPELERKALVSALEPVDVALLFDGDDPSEVLASLRPDICCKSAEYTEVDALPERATVDGYGGEFVFLARSDLPATSAIIAKVRGEVDIGDGS